MQEDDQIGNANFEIEGCEFSAEPRGVVLRLYVKDERVRHLLGSHGTLFVSLAQIDELAEIASGVRGVEEGGLS